MIGKRKRRSAEFKASAILGLVPRMALATDDDQRPADAGDRAPVQRASAKADAAEAVGEVEIGQLHARIGQLVMEHDVLRAKPPVDARLKEAGDDRAQPPDAADQARMRPGRRQPLRVLRRPRPRERREPGADAGHRRAVHRGAAVWPAADGVSPSGAMAMRSAASACARRRRAAESQAWAAVGAMRITAPLFRATACEGG